MGPPADEMTDGFFEAAAWPSVTAAYDGVTAGPPDLVLGPCVCPPQEDEPSAAIEHSVSRRVTLFDGVSGIFSGLRH